MEECHAQDFTYLTMTKYDGHFFRNLLFGGENIADNLAEVISKNNLKQLRIAETGKIRPCHFF